jgi:hypothetical protein
MPLRFFAIFLSAITSSAGAADIAIADIKTVLFRCDHCTNTQQAEQLTRKIYFENLLVINPTEDHARWKFLVRTQGIGKECATAELGKAPQNTTALTAATDSCQVVRAGIETTLNAFEQSIADKFRAAYVYTHGRMKTAPINIQFSALKVPQSVYSGEVSAGTLANNINVRDYVTGRLPTLAGEIPAVKNNPLGVWMDAMDAAGQAHIFIFGDAQVTLKILFADNSYVDALVSTESPVASIKGALDSDGRTVMTWKNVRDFDGYLQNYSSAKNLDTFIRNAEFVGVQVIKENAPHGTKVSCAMNWPTKRLRCTRLR